MQWVVQVEQYIVPISYGKKKNSKHQNKSD